MPRGPRSGWVVLSHPSSLNRPHPPVKETPSHFPFSVIGKVFDIHGLSCLFLSPSGLSSLNFPVLPPSVPRWSGCVHTSVLPQSALAIRHGIGPWQPTFTPQISFVRASDFAASNERLLSLRPYGLLATLTDRTSSLEPAHDGFLLPNSLEPESLRAQWDMLRRQTKNCGKACKDDPLGGKSASSLTHLVWLQKLLFVVQRWKGKRG